MLGVRPNAFPDELVRAYRRRAMLYHPDRNPGFIDEANAKLREMNRAFETLRDPASRAQYDLRVPSEPAASRTATPTSDSGETAAEASARALRWLREHRLPEAAEAYDSERVTAAQIRTCDFLRQRLGIEMRFSDWYDDGSMSAVGPEQIYVIEPGGHIKLVMFPTGIVWDPFPEVAPPPTQ